MQDFRESFYTVVLLPLLVITFDLLYSHFLMGKYFTHIVFSYFTHKNNQLNVEKTTLLWAGFSNYIITILLFVTCCSCMPCQ